jgi:hypothetical protein
MCQRAAAAALLSHKIEIGQTEQLDAASSEKAR